MKQYIVNAITSGKKVYIYFDTEQMLFVNEIVNKYENNDDLIELKDKRYSSITLVNLNLVRYVKTV